VDRSEYSKSEFPSQTKNREKWILDTVRANQGEVLNILLALRIGAISQARIEFQSMHKQDRDALLLPNGILTAKQIEALGSDQKTESAEVAITLPD